MYLRDIRGGLSHGKEYPNAQVSTLLVENLFHPLSDMDGEVDA